MRSYHRYDEKAMNISAICTGTGSGHVQFYNQENRLHNIDAPKIRRSCRSASRIIRDDATRSQDGTVFPDCCFRNRLIAMQRRLASNLSFTAEQKYIWMTQSYPDIFQWVPQPPDRLLPGQPRKPQPHPGQKRPHIVDLDQRHFIIPISLR